MCGTEPLRGGKDGSSARAVIVAVMVNECGGEEEARIAGAGNR